MQKRIIKKIIFLSSTLFLLQIGCSDRERLNPLDPSNPYSQGAPTGLQVFSQRDAVTLRWSPIKVNDLEHYYIYRSTAEGSLSPYDSVSAKVTQYTDNNVTYDTQYTYAIQAQTLYDASRLSNALSIVPGAFDIVVADYYNQSLLKITYDGNRVFERYDGYTPTDLAIINDRIYFTSLWDNSLRYINQRGTVESFALGDGPVDFALDQANQLIYILTRNDNTLMTMTFDGQLRGQASLDVDIDFYSACSYDPILNCLWITDESADIIYRYDLSTNELTLIADDIVAPDELIIDEANGGCWIASPGGILHVQSDNSIERMMENHYIYDISLDEKSGLLYYSGFSRTNQGWEIGYTDETNHTVLYTSYEYIYKIKTIPETTGTGLAIIDGYTAEIIRLNVQGQEIGRFSGIYGATGIGLQ